MARSKKSTEVTPAPKKRVPYLTFGWRLKMAREMAGITTTEAGQLINVSAQTISNWETQRHQPKYGVGAAVEILARIYEADYEWIMTGQASDGSEVWGIKPDPTPVPFNPYGQSGNGDRSTGDDDQATPALVLAFPGPRSAVR